MSQLWIRILFLVCAIYDFLLGIVFLASGKSLFARFDVPAPSHMGYVHFCLSDADDFWFDVLGHCHATLGQSQFDCLRSVAQVCLCRSGQLLLDQRRNPLGVQAVRVYRRRDAGGTGVGLFRFGAKIQTVVHSAVSGRK